MEIAAETPEIPRVLHIFARIKADLKYKIFFTTAYGDDSLATGASGRTQTTVDESLCACAASEEDDSGML